MSREKTFIGIQEAARMLGLTRTHVCRLADRGSLPIAHRDHAGRRVFLKSEVQTFVRQRNNAARAAARRVLAEASR